MKSVRRMVRESVAEALRVMPISSEVFGPISGFARATEEWFVGGSKSAKQSTLYEIFSAFRGDRRPPITADGTIPWPFFAYYGGMSITDPAGWVARIPGGRVLGAGAVITPDDRLLCDVSRELIVGGDQAQHSALRRILLPRAKHLSGAAAVLAVVDINYWHWFFDLLPRVLLLQQNGELWREVDHFIINPLKTKYQRETLEILGVPLDKVVETNYRVQYKADQLLVPSVFTEVPTRWACQLLGKRFARYSDPRIRTRRLYLSRSDASIRRIVNEDDLFSSLAKLGFERVVMSGKAVREQCALFSSAECVVAPHGAGLTNTLFCRPQTRIIEVFPTSYINPCYWVLCDHMDLKYHAFWGDGEVPPPPPSGADVDEWFWSFVSKGEQKDQHIRVDVERLTDLVKGALTTM